MSTRKYGWAKPKEKPTNLYKFSISRTQPLIRKLDLTSMMPPVYDQGSLGSCTANALAACYQYCETKEKDPHPFVPSRLFIYYNERSVEGTVKEDCGAQISDGIKVIHDIGVCPEITNDIYDSSKIWPYNIAKFSTKPPQICYDVAKKNHSGLYKPIPQNINHIKQSIINGFPIVFGFQVYSGFESDKVAKSGILSLPAKSEDLLGGHAVVIVGFDDDMVIDGHHGAVKIRNSWGEGWGLKGYFWMPYKYVTNSNLADDFWSVLQTIEL